MYHALPRDNCMTQSRSPHGPAEAAGPVTSWPCLRVYSSFPSAAERSVQGGRIARSVAFYSRSSRRAH